MTTLKIQTPRWALPLLKPARYKGAYGGRGSGKSHCFAEMLIEAHIMDQSQSSVCVREIQKSLNQSVKRLIEHKISTMNAGAYFEVQDAVIKCKHGPGLIIFQGMQNHTADSIKSLEGYDRAWVEEAQSLSQRSLDLLRPTIRKPGSELWFTWNPHSQDDPVDLLLRGDTPPPDAVVIPVNYDDNPWFPEVLRDEMEYDRRRDPDKWQHVWRGEYIKNSEARVFKNWVVEEFERPEGTIYRLGADWGFSVDPSVLVRCSIEGNRLYVDHEAYMIGCEIVNLPDLFDRVPESRKWFIRADSARPETINYMQKHGYPKIQPAQKGKGSIEEGIAFLQSHDIVVHPRCTHLIDELNSYSYKIDPQTNEILPIIEDKNNHVIDALRYACEGIRKANTIKRQVVAPPIRPFSGATGWMGA
jgi:phage terminase large subunit